MRSQRHPIVVSILPLFITVGCSLDVPTPVEFGDRSDGSYDMALPADHGHTDALSDSQVRPRRCEVSPELCNDLDDDCDGIIDEDFPSLGDPCLLGVGACETQGQLTCAADVDTGLAVVCAYGGTPPEPQVEVCDGVDNDCDGVPDEEIQRDCYEGPASTASVGRCRSGVQTCDDGDWTPCARQILPRAERCNGRDDDCDGTTDEGIVRACYDGPEASLDVGLCRGGEQTCVAGDWTECLNATLPAAERCNGEDDDCDGHADESFAELNEACSVGVGECQNTGVIVCTDDGTTCNVAPLQPRQELCDQLDDDCDGQVDEAFDLVTRCIVGIGECARSAVPVCRDNGQGTRCPVSPGAPVLEGLEDGGLPDTCDGYDNDCDGRVDEQHYGCCINGAFDAECFAGRIPGAGGGP